MSKINLSRVLLGGLATGAVTLVFDAVLAAAIPQAVRSGMMDSTNLVHLTKPTLPGMVTYAAIVLLVGGPAAVWFYAAIRSRFGAGPKTATYAGLWIWLILGPYMQIAMNCMGMPKVFSVGAWVAIDAYWLPVLIVALLAGAAVYREEGAGSAAGAAAGN